MKNTMYVLAIILVIAWIVGFFSTSVGDIIHILLVLAIIAVILSDNQAQKSLKKLISKLR
jgi:c-di-AMP phosphodiesterase-like protein